MIKCYHARKNDNNEVIAPLVATINADIAELEDLWDCCNNSCWWDREDYASMTDYKGKFGVEFTPEYKGYCNDDLIVEMQGLFHVALSFGWGCFPSFEEALNHCKKGSFWCQ